MLAEKLHSLSVVTPDEAKVDSGPIGDRAGKRGEDQVEVEDERRTFVEVAKRRLED